MEKIIIESNKKYRHGFILTEQELRRIVDTCDAQMKKLNKRENEEHNFTYIVTFRNGAVQKSSSLGQILDLKNSGSETIVNLKIICKLGSSFVSDHEIKLNFSNTNFGFEKWEYGPIDQNISGRSRDWVFVTSSLLEERIKKIRRWSFNQLNNRSTRFISIFFFGLSFLAISFLTTAKKFNAEEYNRMYLEELVKLDSLREVGELTDPVEALLRFEKAKLNLEQIQHTPGIVEVSGKTVFYLFVLLPVVFAIFYFIWKRVYPLYNFCWGDYTEVFEKKEYYRKMLINTVFLGLLVSILGGIIVNLL